MGVDPVSMGIMAAGQLAQAGGGILNAREANKDATRQAMARNRVLQEQNAKLKVFRDQNYQKFDANQAGYTPEAQAAAQGKITAGRQADSNAQIADAQGRVNAAPTGIAASAPNPVTADLAARTGSEVGRATSMANAHGQVSGYGDTWSQNEESNKDLARNIDLTNNYARGTNALTGPLQDFAQTAAHKAPSGVGTLISGLGSLASAYGSGGFGGGAGAGKGPGGLSTGGIFSGLGIGGGGGSLSGYPTANVPMPTPRPFGL
jgi:hypothetical protein